MDNDQWKNKMSENLSIKHDELVKQLAASQERVTTNCVTNLNE